MQKRTWSLLRSIEVLWRCFDIMHCLFLLDTVLQPKECIVCRARKTAASFSGYEELVKCSPNPRSSSLISFSEVCLNEYSQTQLTGRKSRPKSFTITGLAKGTYQRDMVISIRKK